jgi:hypothetical protein
MSGINRIIGLFSLLSPSRTASQSQYGRDELHGFVDRVVERVDPCIKHNISGYRKRLESGAEETLLYVNSLTRHFDRAVLLSPDAYGTDPRFSHFFSKKERIHDVVHEGRDVLDFFRSNSVNDHCHALMWVGMKERTKVMTAELDNGFMSSDVRCLQVSFQGHRISSPSHEIEDVRQELRDDFLRHVVLQISQNVPVRQGKGKRPVDEILTSVKEALHTPQNVISIDKRTYHLDPMGVVLEGKKAGMREPLTFHKVRVGEDAVLGVPVLVQIPRAMMDLNKSNDIDLRMASAVLGEPYRS